MTRQEAKKVRNALFWALTIINIEKDKIQAIIELTMARLGVKFK